MKYETVKSTVLTILVVMSLGLTYTIWTYQPTYQPIESNDTFNISIEAQKDYNTLIKPFKLLYHKRNATYGSVEEEELDKVLNELKKWNLYDVRNVSEQYNTNAFLERIHGNDKIEVIFPDLVPSEIYKNVLKFEDTEFQSFDFDRIVIDMSKSDLDTANVYFVDYSNQTLYEARFNSDVLADFDQNVVRYAFGNDRYDFEVINGERRIYFPVNVSELPIQKYLYDEIDPENFKNALFTDPNNVKKDLLFQGEEFSNGTSFMEVMYVSNMLRYVNPSQETNGLLFSSDLVEKSINFINVHGGWTDDFRYFQINPSSRRIVYRLFHQGYPVFNENNMAEMTQRWGIEDIYIYDRPYFEINLRVDLGSEPVQLVSGESAIAFLQDSKNIDDKELQDLMIGYHLYKDPDSPSTSNVIILEPSWYYQYKGIWYRLSIEELGGRANGLE
ncbi:YycH family regulatory protein [Bacillus sp. 2205SS5-2]|uniref:YycH family regulatory protein n=1 Tax=Bacillus sp. 2205SS5-2 TaxID=3109031 RepID=UPI0030046BE4